MKPEQVAHAAWNGFCKQVNLFEIEIAFERAVYDAVIAERERCAQIAESFIPSGFTGDGKAGNSYAVARDDRARTIAAAIRSTSP